MGKAKKSDKVAKLPKKVCCEAKVKCNRCPLRMLKEGTLPAGYTVKRRHLVRLEDVTLGRHDAPAAVGKKAAKKAAVAELSAKAAKKAKKSGKKGKRAA